MTTTQEPTTTTEVPAWLNLDAVCPPELRSKIPALVAEVEALAPIIDDLAFRCWEVLHHLSETLTGLDDAFDVTDEYTGRALLAEPLIALGECFIVAAGERATFSAPQWAKEVQA